MLEQIIRPAVPADYPTILSIYAWAREEMVRRGNPTQWGTNRPKEHLIRQDLKDGNLYVICRDGEICGVFAMIPGIDVTYLSIDGQWHSNEPYAAIHRVAGRGGGIVDAWVEFCRKRMSYLRVDTHKDNYPMRRALTRAGFSYCGNIIVDNGTPRMAYDLVCQSGLPAQTADFQN